MIKELTQTKITIEKELTKFPVSMKTMAIQKRREEMEAQLDKVENSIKLFSKDVVYVGI